MKSITALSAAILALAVPMGPAIAQEGASTARATESKISLQSDVMAIITSTDDLGRVTTKLAQPKEFTPGTKLSFGMNYVNNGAQAAANVTGTSQINEAVRLAPDADRTLVVSVDGGETFGTLDTRAVATETQGTRPATHADVTHVRWTIASIAPGESGRIAFPVIIR